MTTRVFKNGVWREVCNPLEELLLLTVRLWQDSEEYYKCKICGCWSNRMSVERHYDYCPRLRIVEALGHENPYVTMETVPGRGYGLLVPYGELPRIMHELFPDIFEEI